MNLPLYIKLPIIFSLMVAIAAGTVGLMSYLTVNDSLMLKARDELATEGLRSSIRIKDSLEVDYRQAVTLAYDSQFQTFFQEFNRAFEAAKASGVQPSDFADSSEFTALKNQKFGYVSGIKRQLTFSSYYLVNPEGFVVFAEDPSSAVKNNIGANLLEGEFANTDVAKTVQAVLPMQSSDSASSSETPYIMSDLTPDPIKTLFALPLKNSEGQSIGAVLFTKNGNGASRAMIKDLDGANSDRFLLSAKGELLLATMPRAQAEKVISALGTQTDEALTHVLENGEEVTGAVTSFSVENEDYSLITITNTRAIHGETNRLVLILLAQAIAITAVFSLFGVIVSRRNLAPIRHMRGHFHKIADTLDLSYRVNSKKRDEVGSAVRALDRIMTVFDNALSRISEESRNVDTVISNLSESTQSLAYNAEIQSSAIEELSSSVEQTSSQVRSNAQSSQSAYDSAARMNKAVINGKSRVAEMVEAMNDIRVSSNEISRIIKVIDDIAFQTNLLALNAAVEAARAGSQGRGFAVVASEVRNLAGRSTKAAQETQQLIEQSASRVSVGVEISEATKASFENIASDIDYVSSLMADISRASEEQASGVESVNLAINEIARYASNSTTEAEKIALTSEKLIRANAELRNEIGRFATTAEGAQLTQSETKIETHHQHEQSRDYLKGAA